MEITRIGVDKEYEKQPNIKVDDIKNVRVWLKTQSHLPCDYITDLDIILAYHSCENNLENTKACIDLNFTTRNLFSFYQNRTIDQWLHNALQTWLITPLTTATNKGYRPVYCQLLDADIDKFVYSDVVKAFTMIFDLMQYEEGTVPGIIVILNMNKVTLGHISRLDLNVAQQFFFFIQEAMFARLKEFHFINASSYVDKLLSMIRPFMKNEMLDIVKIHQSCANTLEEYLPKTALPKDAGGTYKDSVTLREEIWKKLKANESFFIEESKKRVDETKRPGQPKGMSSFFPNMEGTFKNLEID